MASEGTRESRAPARMALAPVEHASRTQFIARRLYFVLAAYLFIAIVVQVFLAGAGIFSDGSYLDAHRRFIEYFQPVPLFLLVSALVGRMGRFAWIAPIAVFVAFVVQYEFVAASPHLISGLHTLNALLMFWLSLEMTRRSMWWRDA